jgi:hypothetical protein
VTRNVSVDTGPSRYTQNISIAARCLVIGGQLRSNCEAEWKPQSGNSEQIGGLTPLGATRLNIGMGGTVACPPLPHHCTCGSA